MWRLSLQRTAVRARVGGGALARSPYAPAPLASRRIPSTPHTTHSTHAMHTRNQHQHAHISALASAPSASSSSSPSSSSSSSSSRPPLEWPLGHSVSGWRVTQKDLIDEFNLTVYELRHEVSDSLFYHVARADSDNAFSVAFRTPVTSSNGVAHILEHTALCGSRRFPVRDPFFLLVRRSLKTFMNAMTAQDYTMYPFSTQNAKDYQNLLEVYLDAAFFPLLNRFDFLQEGHRLEVDDDNSAAAPAANAESSSPSSAPVSTGGLQIKGVVYNEMKGAMSDTSQLFMSRLQSELFATNSNHWNSGGEPSVIPTLTHDELKSFHAQCYNIDNAVFISYGDRPPPLDTVNERVIEPVMKQRAEKKQAAAADASAPAIATVPPHLPPSYHPEPRLSSPKVVYASCPPDPLIPDPAKQTKVNICYLCPPADPAATIEEREVEQFSLQMLSSLLLDSASAPLYQALIDPNIGSGYAPATGFDNSTREATFGFGLQGIALGDVDRVLSLIQSTLEQVSRDGFPPERIEASIHQIEIAMKHVRSHFGIGMLMRIIPSWAHGTDVVSPLRVTALISRLREHLAAGPYFQRLIQRHILDNPHRVTLVMTPDAEYARKESDAEAAKLSVRSHMLSAADRDLLRAEAAKLIELQNAKQDTQGCQLPSLSAQDINPRAEVITLDPFDMKSSALQSASPPAAAVSPFSAALPRLVSLTQPTNGVGYIRALVSAKSIPLHLRPYLPLYTSFLTEMGTAGRDYRALSHALEMTTGGISAEINVFSLLNDLHQHEEFVLFRSLALQRNIPEMMRLFHEVLHRPTWDHLERLHQLLLQTASSCANSLQDSGSGYATSDASQYLFSSAAASEIYSGIRHVQFVNQIVQAVTNASEQEARRLIEDVADKLKQISFILMQQGLERVFITGDESSLGQLQSHLPTLMTQPTGTSPRGGTTTHAPVDFPFAAANRSAKTFYALPLQVNNVSLVLPTVPYTHPDAATLDVMAKILSSVYVHREVREKGGAYGGHVSHSSDGVLAFSSYRDPNSLRTVDAYHAAADWMMRGDNFTTVDIEEALLSLFSSIDAPKSPAAKGIGQFLFGITNEQRQAYRDRLLKVDKESVLDVCSRYLSPARLASAHITIVGDETSVPAEVRQSNEWQVQTIEMSADAQLDEFDEEGEEEEARP